MTNPCGCMRGVTPGEPYARGACARCFHWMHTPHMRAAMGGDPADCVPVTGLAPARTTKAKAGSKNAPARELPCINLLAATGKTDTCTWCENKQLPVHGCRVHGTCTVTDAGRGGAKCCRWCGDYVTAPAAG